MKIEIDIAEILTWESIIGAVILSSSVMVLRDIIHIVGLFLQWSNSKNHWCLEKEFYETSQRFIRHPNARAGRLWITFLMGQRKSRSPALIEHIKKFEQKRDYRRRDLQGFLTWRDPAGSVDLSDFMLFKVDDIFSLNDDQSMGDYFQRAGKCEHSLGVIEANHRSEITDYVEKTSFLRYLPSYVRFLIWKRVEK